MNPLSPLLRLFSAWDKTAAAYEGHADRIEAINAELDARFGLPSSAATLAADELGDDGQANGQPQLASPRRKR